MPAFVHTDLQPVPREDRGGPNVLIMCPTRELALQIDEEVKKYEYKGIKSVCLYECFKELHFYMTQRKEHLISLTYVAEKKVFPWFME